MSDYEKHSSWSACGGEPGWPAAHPCRSPENVLGGTWTVASQAGKSATFAERIPASLMAHAKSSARIPRCT